MVNYNDLNLWEMLKHFNSINFIVKNCKFDRNYEKKIIYDPEYLDLSQVYFFTAVIFSLYS